MTPLKKLYIEPTSNCNLQCDMCFRHTWFDENYLDMDETIFKNIMDSIPKETHTIFFGGMGEPLHHPNILDMVKESCSKNYKVELLTNGSLLDQFMIESLIGLGLSKLWVSIDALEPTDINGVGHPNYIQMIETLDTINRSRKKSNFSMDLGITFVANKHNVYQIASLPYFITRYMINDVNISNMYPSTMEAQEDTLYQRTLNMSIGSDTFGTSRPHVSLPYMDFDLAQVQEGLLGLFSKMNFNLEVLGTPTPRRSQYCSFVNEGMTFVRSDGNVSPCMALLHNGTSVLGTTERKVHHHSFGNLKTERLDDIWNSIDYRDFRKRVEDFAFSPCMNCGHCEFPESNQDDCFGNEAPTCGACLWAEGLLSCP